MSNELARGRAIAGLPVRDPRLFADYLRAWWAGRAAPAPAGPPARMGTVLDVDAGRRAVAERTGTESAEGPALAAVRAHAAPSGERDADRVAAGLAGDPALGELAYAVVRAVRPAVVVETGVASGVTSAHVLAALADNGAGRLESVDLPPMAMVTEGLVGSAVPPPLRGRWRLRRGSSRRLLPEVLVAAGSELGVFIHDADHSYDAMRWELERAWPALRPGGWLMADDAHHHSAFQDVADAAGVEALYVAQPGKSGVTGLAVKP
jgi:predicted O-methyltransferase YrrM